MNNLKTFEEWNPFKKKIENTPPPVKTHRETWNENRRKLAEEAEKYGYDSVEDYLDMLEKGGSISRSERDYYDFG